MIPISTGSESRFDLKFRMFGVPVRVQPVFWLTGLLLGGGIKAPDLLLLWLAVVLVSILVHELGHVFAMRATGGDGHIVLAAFGGLAIPLGARPERSAGANVLVSAAGPLAQLLLGSLLAGLVLLMGGVVRPVVGSIGLPYLVAAVPAGGYYVHYGINFLLHISFLWSLLNLAPVYPLDGGQIVGALIGVRAILLISLVTAVGIAVLAYVAGNPFLAVLFASLAFSNFQQLQTMKK